MPCCGSHAVSQTRISPPETVGIIVQNQKKSTTGRATARRTYGGVVTLGSSSLDQGAVAGHQVAVHPERQAALPEQSVVETQQ